MTIAVIGTGLIGGSMALALKDLKIAEKVIGVDVNNKHLQKALELGIIDQPGDLKSAVENSDLIIVAIPVHSTQTLLPEIMNYVSDQVVMDVSSTKETIIESLKEYSGPEAAVRGAFAGKVTVISGKENSDKDAIELVEDIYHKLGMRIIYMDPASHDIHAAYVSHISHITSFALANTVLEKEKEESAIFDMASAGFESTVRLAKSNPAMWVQIFLQNRENILDVLNEHISQLRKFKSCLEKENETYLTELIDNANKIRKILK